MTRCPREQSRITPGKGNICFFFVDDSPLLSFPSGPLSLNSSVDICVDRSFISCVGGRVGVLSPFCNCNHVL